MSDPLLDEATRLADNSPGHPHAAALLRALVERVQAAEQEAETQAGIAAIRTAERDEARGKLDKVRAAASRYLNECDQSEVLASDVLAILDGDNGR